MRAFWVAGALLAWAGFAQAQAVPPPPAEKPAISAGTVIFSRSVDKNGSEPVVTAPVEAAAQAAAAADGPTNEERQAVTFVSYDLDVHLQPREHAMAVRARIVLRNDSATALRRLPLQLSSTLHWTSAHIAGTSAPLSQKLVDSDMDHTGALREAVIPMAQPLGPKQSLAVELTYEGTVPVSAERLTKIGTPADVAQASDWDRISEEFVGLRGFGNVAWYPIASAPVALGDGAKFFTEAAEQRQRQSQATVAMQITEEFFGEAPNLAVLDGITLPVQPDSLPATASVPGIARCTLPATRLGLSSPSFFLLTRTAREGSGVTVFARTEDVANAQAYLTAASLVAPLLDRWFGKESRTSLKIVDLPEPGDDAFEDGDVLFANVHPADANNLTGALVHSLTHLYFHSPYAWLQEGVATFMATLWVEQARGRDVAIEQLDNGRAALSLAEPGDQQVLMSARDPVYYRTKATYVFWMLRDLAGDEDLGKALRAYQPGSDTNGIGFQQVLERASTKDLKWFFEDWVYHDRGLPDLSIAGVFPNKANVPGSYIVAVDVANGGEPKPRFRCLFRPGQLQLQSGCGFRRNQG